MRYFINKENGQSTQVGEYTPSILYKCLTATRQVGTEMVEIEGQMVEQPKLELVWEEITEQEYLDKTKVVEVEYTPSYNELVNDKIRERYSLSEELAILRQKDSKVDEFVEYNNYCENCKQQARLELGIK